MRRQHPPLPRAVWLLVAARAVHRLGAFSLPFLTVTLVQTFHAPLRVAGLVMAAFGLATIPSRLLGGRLADRLGARATITLGLAGCAVAQLGIAAAHTLPQADGAAVALGLAHGDLRWLFVVDAATCLGCAVVVALALPRTPRRGAPAAATRHTGPWRDG